MADEPDTPHRRKMGNDPLAKVTREAVHALITRAIDEADSVPVDGEGPTQEEITYELIEEGVAAVIEKVEAERDSYLAEIRRRDQNLNGCVFCKRRRDIAMARGERIRAALDKTKTESE